MKMNKDCKIKEHINAYRRAKAKKIYIELTILIGFIGTEKITLAEQNREADK